MAVKPDVLALIEEMIDSSRSPEDVCRDRPELLAEVRKRWAAFRRVDGALAALFPDSGVGAASAARHATDFRLGLEHHDRVAFFGDRRSRRVGQRDGVDA